MPIPPSTPETEMGGSMARLVSVANSRLPMSQKQSTQTQKQSTVDYKNINNKYT